MALQFFAFDNQTPHVLKQYYKSNISSTASADRKLLIYLIVLPYTIVEYQNELCQHYSQQRNYFDNDDDDKNDDDDADNGNDDRTGVEDDEAE